MASLIDNLIAIMDEEAICYENYLEIANNKKDVIIKGNMPSLQQITQEEEIVAGQLFRLEKKRKDIIEDICTVTNRKIDNFRIRELVGDLKTRPEEAEKLQQTAERLTAVLEKCNQANQLNKMLIEQSLEFLEFSINALSGLTQAHNTSTYKRKGESYNGKEASRFDTKQ